MSWIPTSPVTKPIAGPTISQVIDRYRVANIDVASDGSRCALDLLEGYDAAGEFVPTSLRRIEIPDPGYPGLGLPALGAALLALADPSKSVRDNVRASVYDLLVQLGELPAGTAS